MADYPYYPRRTALRLGAVGLACLVVLTIFAVTVRARRSAAFEQPLPLHPTATAVTTRQMKLLRWRVTSYSSPATADELQAFYDQRLPADGWTARGSSAVADQRVSRYLRDGFTLEVQTRTDGDTTRVNLMLAVDGPTSERQG